MTPALNMYLQRCEHYCCPNGTSQAIYNSLKVIHVQIHNVLHYTKCKQAYLRSSLATRGVGRFRLGVGRYMTKYFSISLLNPDLSSLLYSYMEYIGSTLQETNRRCVQKKQRLFVSHFFSQKFHELKYIFHSFILNLEK